MIASVKSPLDQLSAPRRRPKHGKKEQPKDQPPA